nr:hypothetical protein [Streptomyces sp. SID11385]
MLVDSRLQAIYEGHTGADADAQALTRQLLESLGRGGARDVLDGMCTLIYVYVCWLREVAEDHGKEIVAFLIPSLVETMRMMPRAFPAPTIPTATALVLAAATDLSPSLWRTQYGGWTAQEMIPLEATAVLLAERINRMTDDHDFAARLVTQLLADVDADS